MIRGAAAIVLLVTTFLLTSSRVLLSFQPYPTRPVSVLVGFGPGSAPDLEGRVVAQNLSRNLGQAFVVENRVGNSGNLASEDVARSKPDGYTLLVTTAPQWAMARVLFKSLQFDPVADFQPIFRFSTTPIYIVTNAHLPATNFKELVALLRANPGKYNYGTPGPGTVHHLGFEVVKAHFGLKVQHIAYRGSAQIVPALVTGEIMIAVQAYPQIAQYVENGALRVLAVMSSRRSLAAPEVPTLKELGLKDAEFDLGTGFVAPAGTPVSIVNVLAYAIGKAIDDDKVRKLLTAAGGEPYNEGPQEFAAKIRSDADKYAAAAKLAGVTALQ